MKQPQQKNQKNKKPQSRLNYQDSGFSCGHCGFKVSTSNFGDPHHRNHCPNCLWSRHLDIETGDRRALCQGLMEPLALMLKNEGYDKFGKKKTGELMIVHRCQKCGKLNFNRLYIDDNEEAVIQVLKKSVHLNPEIKKELNQAHIEILDLKDYNLVAEALWGKSCSI